MNFQPCFRRPLASALAAVSFALLSFPAQADGTKKMSPAATLNQPAATTAGGAQRDAYRFAVEHFDTADSLSFPGWDDYQTQLNNAVCDMLTTEMVNSGRDMVERSRLKDVLGEQDLVQGGRVDASTGADTGKVLGADYLILGTITEWGMKSAGGGVGTSVLHHLGGIFGGGGSSVNYQQNTAEVKIDYRVVNARTGRIVAGSAGTAQGDETTKGIALQTNWYNSIDFSNSEWTQTQIGKATRAAVKQIAQQLSTWTPNDGGAVADRAPLKASVLAIISPDEFVIDKGQTDDVRVGDVLDVVNISSIKNATGQVVYQTEKKIGSATVEEVQTSGAKLHFTSLDPGSPALKEGDGVRTPAPATH